MNKILGVLLLIGVFPLPYDYYIYLRTVIMIGTLYLLVRDWKESDSQTKVVLIVITLLFNSLSPIYLTKTIWVVIDIVSSLYLFNYKKNER
jgi:hypothetical protein